MAQSKHTIAGNIGQAIAAASAIGIVYEKDSGIAEARTLFPSRLKRCANGNTVVVGFCPHRQAPRSFTLSRISYASHFGVPSA